MSDARRQLRNAKKLVRLRLVEQSRASMKVAQTQERIHQATEALAAAERAIEDGDREFTEQSPRWGSISSFEAALARREARTGDVVAHNKEVEDGQQAQEEAIDELRAHDARLSAAEQLVLLHRQRLRRTLERLEQTITDDLSVLKKSQDS
ncbi:MAG: hypothetical protein ACE37F_02630 [Nannocystaceae bacterium]|nr:hypothetical protein [bacterium]